MFYTYVIGVEPNWRFTLKIDSDVHVGFIEPSNHEHCDGNEVSEKRPCL